MSRHRRDDLTEFTHDGHKFGYRIEHDAHMGPPWEEHDGHGLVSDHKYWAPGQGVKPPKRPGERILFWDRGYYRTYDWQATMRLARTEWGFKSRKQAADAVEIDFERLRMWCNDQWHWVGVIVVALDDDGEPMEDFEASLWGIESDSHDYHTEVAKELAEDVLAQIKAQIEEGVPA